MSGNANKPCPICHGLATMEDTKQPFYRYGVGDFDSYICKDCGFIAEFKLKETIKRVTPKEERDYDY